MMTSRRSRFNKGISGPGNNAQRREKTGAIGASIKGGKRPSSGGTEIRGQKVNSAREQTLAASILTDSGTIQYTLRRLSHYDKPGYA